MLIIGLMSGTSADGIDTVLCEIAGEPPALAARIVQANTYPYDPAFRQRILNACQPDQSRVDKLCQLNVDLGERLAQAALGIIEGSGLSPADVDLVGSHGQTVWHVVQPDGRVTATLQVGEAAVIAERTGITVVGNFRPRDVAAGGQGAPLTAYVDWLLLRHPTGWRAVQNIGGIGNVTFLPPLADTDSAPLAFDTGPGNVLIDTAVTLLTGGRQHYDRDGLLAAQGQVDEDWLLALLAHSYYTRRPPKTTGRELFSAAMGEALVTQGRRHMLADPDIVATLTALTATSIADAYRRYSPAPITEVLLAGGGVRNPTLLGMITRQLQPVPVLTHDAVGINSDYKEGLVFAVLAYETWHARPGTHPALTGARHGSVLGQITPGMNYVDLLRRTWNNPHFRP